MSFSPADPKLPAIDQIALKVTQLPLACFLPSETGGEIGKAGNKSFVFRGTTRRSIRIHSIILFQCFRDGAENQIRVRGFPAGH